MDNIRFSFIMPVYKVEKHLKTAIDSVLAQTYNNFEIVLVDDASRIIARTSVMNMRKNMKI